MHLQLMPNDRIVMFDATSLGKSAIELPPDRCRLLPNTNNTLDCYAHAIEYDIATNKVRTLKVLNIIVYTTHTSFTLLYLLVSEFFLAKDAQH